MINPAIKAANISLAAVAAQILAIPNFNFATYAQAHPFSVYGPQYGLTNSQYRALFVPDVVNSTVGPDQAPTLTNSPASRVASNINKFVAFIKTQF